MNYLKADNAAIEEILKQAPASVTNEDVKLAYYNAKRDVSQALADLWNLPPLPEKPKPVGVDAEKWAEIRQSCDEFDQAANEALNNIRKNSAHQSAPGAHGGAHATTIQSPLVTIHEKE